MDANEQTRLCGYLGELSRKTHIASRHLFSDYKRQLERDRYLTEKQIEHLFPFIQRDTTMSPDALKKYLSQFVRPATDTPNTLEEFFE